MLSNYVFLVLSLAIIIGFAVRGWQYGVISTLWGVVGAVGGIVGGVLLYRGVLVDLDHSKGAKLALAFLGGLAIYLIIRALVKLLLDKLFEPGGALQFLSDGFGGMVVSLVPSLLTIAIIACGLRITGTLTEMRRYEFLATPNRYIKTNLYPDLPLATRWRNGMEDIPGLRPLLDRVTLFGSLEERTLTGLLIVTKKPALKTHLEENLESKPVFDADAFVELLENEAVQKLNEAGDRIGLLQHPDVKAAAADAELGPRLKALELSRLVDAFLLSPEWQEVVESFKRGPEDR